jgi:hypothetical protein
MKGGPTVIMGQKQPSITSTCASFTPVLSKSEISEPSESRLAVITPTLSVGTAARSNSRALVFAMRSSGMAKLETGNWKLEIRGATGEFPVSRFKFPVSLLTPNS